MDSREGCGYAPATQIITFPTPVGAVAGYSQTLHATASSGLAVTYTLVSSPPLIATLSGTPVSVVNFTGPGSVSITASQAGNSTYAATSVTDTFTVAAPSVYTATAEPVGTPSATLTATVPITVAGTLGAINVLTQGLSGLDYTFVSGGTCSTSTAYTIGQSCTVNYIFTPEVPGIRLGAITLTNGTTLLGSSLLQGTGNGPQALFQTGVLQTTYATSLNSGRGLTVDAAGNVFVANQGSKTVLKYAAGSSTATTLATFTAGTGGTAVDGAGNVFVVVTGSGIYEIVGGAAGTTPTRINSTLVNGDNNLSVDGAGNLYTSDTNTGAIYKLSAGNYASTTTLVLGGNGHRFVGMALDSTGNLFAADYNNNKLYELTAGATSLTALYSSPTPPPLPP